MTGTLPPGGSDGDADDDDKVGYKHPPKRYRWSPGQSGNPTGRKPGAIGMKRILREESGSRVAVTIERGGTKRTVKLSKLHYAVKLLVDKAMKGDQRSIEQLISLNISIFGLGEDEDMAENKLTPGELAYMDSLLSHSPLGDAAARHQADPSAVAINSDDELSDD